VRCRPAIQNTSLTWPKLRLRPRLGPSVLAQGQDDACVRRCSKRGDGLASVGWEAVFAATEVIDSRVWEFGRLGPVEACG
jgi:hypothetical protein